MRPAILILLAGLGLVGCASTEGPAPSASAQAEAVPSAWSSELDRLDRTIDATKARLADRRDLWLTEAQLASLYQQRARLAGGLDDYAQAEAAIERAFAVAPEGSGPFLARASLNLSLHRVDRVEADLVRAESRVSLDEPTRSQIAVTRARLAIERGQYDVAREQLDTAAAASTSMGLHAARATLAWKTGDYDGAEGHLAKAEAAYHGTWDEPRAWFHLLRGLMDLERDQLDQAMAHYRDAHRAMPGYWLVAEHKAEIHALQGRPERALAIYAPVVEQTGSPELMSAMAGVLKELGRDSEADRWAASATAAFADQIERYPEAAAGHALEHHLELGDPQIALELAQHNATLRPNPEALEQLARAEAAAL